MANARSATARAPKPQMSLLSLATARGLERVSESSPVAAAAPGKDADELSDDEDELEEEEAPVGCAAPLEPVACDDPLEEFCALGSSSASSESSFDGGDELVLPPLELVATSSVLLPPASPPKTVTWERSAGGLSSVQTVTSPGP